jgi:predicted phosphodiesterase
MKEGEAGLGQRLARAGAWGGVGFAMSSAAAIGFANHAETNATFGAHEVAVSPTFDGHATLDQPGVLKLRLPAEAPLNLGVNLRITDTPDPNTAVQRDVYIATQPEGEKDNLGEVVNDMLVDSALKGLGVGMIATGGLFWYTYSRRKHPEGNDTVTGKIGAGAAIFSIGWVAATYGISGGMINPTDNDGPDKWSKVADLVPAVQAVDDPLVKQIEVNKTDISASAIDIINGLVDSFNSGKKFYADVVERVPDIISQIHQPEDGQTVAVIVSDRHDNILMDPVIRTLADAGGATMVISLGDDTSSGESWEAFSINSLDEAFGDYKYKVAVTGNHDQGTFIPEALQEKNWVMPNDEVIEVNGIAFAGSNDPRSSNLGHGIKTVGEEIGDQSQELAATTCDPENVDKHITLLTHDPEAAVDPVYQGCVDLALSGHKHVQIGPEVVSGQNGQEATTYTNGTTGGAAFAMALGGKPRRDAQTTLVTWEGGIPVGIQPIMIRTTGEIEVLEYWELPTDTPVVEAAGQRQQATSLDRRP